MKILLLIDANSIIHRAFHALPPLTAKDSSPAQALYGLASILIKIWREDKPDYAAACFDRPEPTFREEKYKEYKAQRPATPETLVPQIIAAREEFEEFGIRTFEQKGLEADDLIASLTTRFAGEPELQIVILTGDRDTLQLVFEDKIVVRAFKKGVSETTTWNDAAVREKFGLGPSQLIDYKALVGDQSDNIKGVPGIGPKTAEQMLQKYNSLENIVKNLAKDKKLAEKLQPYLKEMETSRELVALRHNAELEVSGLRDLEFKPDRPRVAAYLDKLGFVSLIKRIENGSVAVAKQTNPKTAQGRIF
ncbi:MAG: 5'-3' exonuclease H3TH domain-containing protein [Patescibacteria group bacterium]